MAAETQKLLGHLLRLTDRATSDAALLARWAQGKDENAFATLVARHGPMVLGVCGRVLGDRQLAEDAFQATFLVVARKAAILKRPDALPGYLYGVALRVARKARARRLWRSTAVQSDGPEPTDPRPHALDALSGRELLAMVDAEVARLPEVYRLPVLLCVLQERSVEETARILDWSTGSVRGRLARGRQMLRERLAGRGLTPSGGALALLSPAKLPHHLVYATLRNLTSAAPAPVNALAVGTSMGLVIKALCLVCVMTGVGLGAGLLLLRSPQSPAPLATASLALIKEKPHLDVYGDPLPAEAIARLGTLRLYHGHRVARVVLSPDPKLVVSFSRVDGNRLWDAVTGQELPLRPELKMVPVFPARGKLVALEKRDKNELICPDLSGGGVVRLPLDAPEIPKHWPNGPWQQDLLSPDGTIRAVIKEKRIHLLDAKSGKELEPLADQPAQIIGSLAFSPDGKLLAASDPRGVRLWDVAKRKFLHLCRAKDFQVTVIVFSADGKILAGADGNSVTLWDVARGKWRHEFHHTYCVGALAFLPDGKTLLSGSGYNDPVIRLWDPFTGREKGQWHGHKVDVQTIALSPDGKLAVSGGQDKTLRLWDVTTGKELRRLGSAKEMIWSATFSPDGQTIASGAKVVRLWNVSTGQELCSFGDGTILEVGFSPDGKVAASVASSDGNVRLWEVATGRELRQFGNRGEGRALFAFCADGRTLATGDSAGPIHIWDLSTGREIRMMGGLMKPYPPGTAYALGSITFSPDGRTLAAGYSDETVRLWEVASGQERVRFHGHRGGVVTLAFSPDGGVLASGSWDRTVMTWDLTGQSTSTRRPGKLKGEKLIALWDDLAGGDAKKAYRAIQTLLGTPPQTIPFLKEHLHSAVPTDSKRVAQLVADLDSDQYDVREKASKGLGEIGDSTEPALRSVLAGQPSPELRRRAERLLAQLDPSQSLTLLRSLRCTEVLEHIGTPAARKLLHTLASGAPAARLTREAQASLDRLAKRPRSAP
jgi:RNA polymerase sigma factor (sigma-70 family)